MERYFILMNKNIVQQTKKLLHIKRNNQQNENATYRKGENIHKPCNF